MKPSTLPYAKPAQPLAFLYRHSDAPKKPHHSMAEYVAISPLPIPVLGKNSMMINVSAMAPLNSTHIMFFLFAKALSLAFADTAAPDTAWDVSFCFTLADLRFLSLLVWTRFVEVFNGDATLLLMVSPLCVYLPTLTLVKLNKKHYKTSVSHSSEKKNPLQRAGFDIRKAVENSKR